MSTLFVARSRFYSSEFDSDTVNLNPIGRSSSSLSFIKQPDSRSSSPPSTQPSTQSSTQVSAKSSTQPSTQVSTQLSAKSSGRRNRGSILDLLPLTIALNKAEIEQQEVFDQWQSTRIFLGSEARSPLPLSLNNANLESETVTRGWRSIVKDASCLISERKCVQQEAVWELIKTELQYIGDLETLCGFFLAAFQDLHYRSYPWFQVEIKKIFGNVEELLEANRKFWNQSFSPALRNVDGSPLDATCPSLYEGFMRIEEYFEPYLTFCTQYHNLIAYYKTQKESVYFSALIEWFRMQPISQRLDLSSWLMKPVQRLTKYHILLNGIWKNTDDPSQSCRLRQMIDKMENFVHKINARVREMEENEVLDRVYSRITGYDIFESVTEEVATVLKQYSDLTSDLHRNRKFVREFIVNFKRVDKSVRRMEGVFFVFSDVVILCRKSSRKLNMTKLKISHAPISLHKIRMHPLREVGSFLMVILGDSGSITDAQVIYAKNPAQMESLISCIQQTTEKLSKISSTLTVHRNPKDISVNFDFADMTSGAAVNSDFNDETSTDCDSVSTLTAASPEKVMATRPQLVRMRSVSCNDVGPKHHSEVHSSLSLPFSNSSSSHRGRSFNESIISDETTEITNTYEETILNRNHEDSLLEPAQTIGLPELVTKDKGTPTDQEPIEISENSDFVITDISPATSPFRRRATPRFATSSEFARTNSCSSSLLRRQHAFRNIHKSKHRRYKRHLTDTVACKDLDHQLSVTGRVFRTRINSWPDNESPDDRNGSSSASNGSLKSISSDSVGSTLSIAETRHNQYLQITTCRDQMGSSCTNLSSGFGSPGLEPNMEDGYKNGDDQMQKEKSEKNWKEVEERSRCSMKLEEDGGDVLENLFSVVGVNEAEDFSDAKYRYFYENSSSSDNNRQEDIMLVISSDELEETYI